MIRRVVRTNLCYAEIKSQEGAEHLKNIASLSLGEYLHNITSDLKPGGL